MKRIFVIPGEKVGMRIILQYPIALLCKRRIVDSLITKQRRKPLLCKMVLIIDPIGRIGKNKLDKAIGQLIHKLKGIHVINGV